MVIFPSSISAVCIPVALTIAGVVSSSLLQASPVLAQITPDDTLGNERSTVRQDSRRGIDRIEGGATRGANLFHSFEEFNIGVGQRVYFANPAGIANILSRITGNSSSSILGTLGVLGDANLFLLNPNGIIFGANAQLDIRGSFLATTADAIQFGDQGFFSAINPEFPPLLTVNPSAFLFNQIQRGDITNRSIAPAGGNPIGQPASGLRVGEGSKLTLLGGTVNLEGGRLNAFGGRAEIGAVSGIGTIALNPDGSLSFPSSVERSDVSLTNGAAINTAAGGGGEIAINARNINLSGGSTIRTGILLGLGGDGMRSGDIRLDATDSIAVRRSQLNASSRGRGDAGDITVYAANRALFEGTGVEVVNNSLRFSGVALSRVESNSVGQAGNITISADSISFSNAAALNSSNVGQGNSGNIILHSSDQISLDTASLGSDVRRGQGGNIQISTGSFRAINGSGLTTSVISTGQGVAGDVVMHAAESISFGSSLQIGELRNGSGIFSGVGGNANGQGGDIRISSHALLVTNGAQLVSSVLGQGDAGDIIIRVNDRVLLEGTGVESLGLNDRNIVGTIISSVGATGFTASGQGGDIRILADSLSLANGASLNADSFGQGSAGNIHINITDNIDVDSSFISSTIQEGAIGDGGSLYVSTRSLSATNGSLLASATLGQGSAGDIIIRASDFVTVNGISQDGFSSSISSGTFKNAGRQGGDITITTPYLLITNGAVINAGTDNSNSGGTITINANTVTASRGGQIITSAQSNGQAGSIILNVTGNVNLSGRDLTFNRRVQRFGIYDGTDRGGITLNQDRGQSGLFANTRLGSTGNGGSILIGASRVSLSNGASIVANSLGQGQGGNIHIEATNLLLENRALISSATSNSNGGDVSLHVNDALLLRDRSNITTEAGTQRAGGNGGNIDINAPFIVAVPNEDSNINANAFRGNGGNINITTESILGLQASERSTSLSNITASSQFGLSGDISITTPEVNPSQGLVELPSTIIDASQQITQTCSAAEAETSSEFVVTGRGGLPPDPTQLLSNETVVTRLATLDNTTLTEDSNGNPFPHLMGEEVTPPASTPPIVEAQGWSVDAEGNVVLISQAPAVTPNTPGFNSIPCNQL